MTEHNSHQLFLHIAEYIDVLQAKAIRNREQAARRYASDSTIPVAQWESSFLSKVDHYSIDDHPRSKYIRIKVDSSNGQTFVHAFVDRTTGSVYKPAGWKAPAKGKDGKPSERYNLFNDESRALLLERCEFSGGYLYADRAGA